ncbi:GrpB family protein [Robertkochia solimangrovi]|uniref:GrpB family protein n=1 Tax=Robertkochia solimangrovi TaxID=2213046 RepID=UPI00117CDF42|nr:GrpB family protein [Robertkochia solimangrovi]TRZ41825.1 GrpB family protein [Robertkochia solimangrovi]
MKNTVTIIIEPFSLQWEKHFSSLQAYLLQYLENDILNIEHVGSTAVPGMSAKPVIDLDIVISNDNTVMKRVIDKLEMLGYQHCGEMGISGREAFKRRSSKVRVTDSNKEWFKHHLYLCKEGSVGLRNHLALKKHLLENPQMVVEYSALKRELAMKYPNDMEAYIEGKTEFILNILKIEGLSGDDLDLIKKENEM